MKTKLSSPRLSRGGFTLTELLVVIAIIGILAGMLLPVLAKVPDKAKKMKAKAEMADLVNAINAYDTDYGRFPMTSGAGSEQYFAGTNDFTCGYVQNPQTGVTWLGINSGWTYGNNSNVVAILMDLTTYPNGLPTQNINHQKNPKQVKYLNAKLSGDPGTGSQPLGGVDNNGIYRDPWGNPYVITMNSSYNEQGTKDFFYSTKNVSQQSGTAGYNGLFNPVDNNGNGDHFLYHGKVMVWSAGPDKQVDPNANATVGLNKDNVVSW